MNMQRVIHLLITRAVPCVVFSADRAQACAVCFGDPESSMAKGAVAGVFAMIGFVSFVLLAIAGTGLLWVRRGRRIQQHDVNPPAGEGTAQQE